MGLGYGSPLAGPLEGKSLAEVILSNPLPQRPTAWWRTRGTLLTSPLWLREVLPVRSGSPMASWFLGQFWVVSGMSLTVQIWEHRVREAQNHSGGLSGPETHTVVGLIQRFSLGTVGGFLNRGLSQPVQGTCVPVRLSTCISSRILGGPHPTAKD